VSCKMTWNVLLFCAWPPGSPSGRVFFCGLGYETRSLLFEPWSYVEGASWGYSTGAEPYSPKCLEEGEFSEVRIQNPA
jgi:hypothetical protein